jgi:hypothetical protein
MATTSIDGRQTLVNEAGRAGVRLTPTSRIPKKLDRNAPLITVAGR